MAFWSKKNTRSELKYFVSIGAGINQIPLIQEAKKLGFHVIGVDQNNLAPGFLHCDLKIQEALENHEEIYKKLRELLVDGEYRAIMTRSFGTAIKTTAYLCMNFDLPFLDPGKCDFFTNKQKMKKAFFDYNINTPDIIKLRKKSSRYYIDESLFPVIIKPVQGHAKEGIKLIKDLNTLNKEIPSKSTGLLIERYIPGSEFIAAGIVYKKKYYLAECTDKETSGLPYFADMLHTAPSKYLSQADEITSIGQAVADIFEIQTAPLIMEFISDKDGTLYLIEAVPEFGGEFLTDILIPQRTGYNFFEETIKAHSGMNFKAPQLSPMKKNRNAVAVKYISGEKGILSSCSPDGPEKIPEHVFSRIFKEIGAHVNKVKTNHERLGVVITKSSTVEGAIKAAKKAEEAFEIKIKKS